MAAPTLAFEGALTAVTTGNLTVTLPSHQADDILIVNLVGWVPNTAGSAAGVAAPAGWNKITGLFTPASGNADGELSWFWKRAASGAETNPTFTRPTGWDTGVDGVWSGRAYTVRGCDTAANPPWDAAVASAIYNTANQACAAVTVSGAERTVIHFQCEQDNLAQGTMTGWTPGTAVTDTTGTDSGFKTHRKENVSTSTTADASTAVAPAQGFYAFLGISFFPPTAISITGSGSPVATLSKTASGTAVQKFNASGSPVKTLSKTASGTVVQKFNASGSPVATLSKTASGAAVQKFNASGSPVKTLSATASGSATMTPDAPTGITGSGSPVATLSATASGSAVEIFNASGAPTASLSKTASGAATQKFNASGSPVKTLSATASGAATMTPDAPAGFNASGSPVATLSTSATGSATETFNASGSPARRLSAFANGVASNPSSPVVTKRKARGYLIDAEQPEPYREPEPTPITVIDATPLPDAPELPAYERVELTPLRLEPIRWNPKTNRPVPVEDIEVVVEEVEQIDEDEEILLQILSII